MSRSADQTVRDLQAALDVQRVATRVYQAELAAAYANLRMLGREDIVKSIQREALHDVRGQLVAEAKPATPQPAAQPDTEDDLLY